MDGLVRDTAAAAGTAFLLVLASGRPLIRLLAGRKILDRSEKGDSDRLDALHTAKSATPTLGGVLLLGAAVGSTLFWANLREPALLLLLGCVLALGVVGFVDDLRKLRTKKGLTARVKFRLQLLIGLLAGVCLYLWPIGARATPEGVELGTALSFPPFWRGSLELGPFHVIFVALVMTGASNAVNITDGLDGLAAGTSLLVAGALLVVSIVVGSADLSAAFAVPHVPAAGAITVFLGALVGGGLGFLWFNCHPAQIFMGDTGALALGGALGLAAVLLKQELLLVLVGGVLVVEALSVILQVASFKLRRKRIFLIAPLHHHFQFKGWPETKVTARFWIAGAVLALVSLLKLAY